MRSGAQLTQDFSTVTITHYLLRSLYYYLSVLSRLIAVIVVHSSKSLSFGLFILYYLSFQDCAYLKNRQTEQKDTFRKLGRRP
jgi:hypothetical protein